MYFFFHIYFNTQLSWWNLLKEWCVLIRVCAELDEYGNSYYFAKLAVHNSDTLVLYEHYTLSMSIAFILLPRTLFNVDLQNQSSSNCVKEQSWKVLQGQVRYWIILKVVQIEFFWVFNFCRDYVRCLFCHVWDIFWRFGSLRVLSW